VRAREARADVLAHDILTLSDKIDNEDSPVRINRAAAINVDRFEGWIFGHAVPDVRRDGRPPRDRIRGSWRRKGMAARMAPRKYGDHIEAPRPRIWGQLSHSVMRLKFDPGTRVSAPTRILLRFFGNPARWDEVH
jgi:hypothetical protein